MKENNNFEYPIINSNRVDKKGTIGRVFLKFIQKGNFSVW